MRKLSPEKQFFKVIGGNDRMIPKEHGLPIILRIHHAQISDALGVRGMGRKAKSILGNVDGFYGYKPRTRYHYEKGITPTNEANPASDFWATTALKQEELNEIQEGFRKLADSVPHIQRVRQLQKAESSPLKRGALRLVDRAFTRRMAKEVTDRALIMEVDIKFLNRSPGL